jgi:hypothetical protein
MAAAAATQAAVVEAEASHTLRVRLANADDATRAITIAIRAAEALGVKAGQELTDVQTHAHSQILAEVGRVATELQAAEAALADQERAQVGGRTHVLPLARFRILYRRAPP